MATRTRGWLALCAILALAAPTYATTIWQVVPPPTGDWSGTVRYRRTVEVPETAEGDYVFAVGIYDGEGILRLLGPRPAEGVGTPVWLGTVRVARGDAGITGISLTPPKPVDEPGSERTNPEGTAIDFGFALTDGAFRVKRTDRGLRLVPLPDHPPFSATLRLDQFGYAGVPVTRVLADARDVGFDQRGDAVTLEHDGETFAYDIVLAQG